MIELAFDAQTMLILLIFFVAAFVKGTTGLGFSTFAIAMLAMFLKVEEAIPLILIPSLLSNGFVMRDAGHFKETVHRFWPMFILTVPGIFIGLYFLVSFEQGLASIALGSILLLHVCFSFLRPNFQMPTAYEKPLAPFVGISTGVVNGLTGAQVMPVLPYLMSLDMEQKRFIQAINCSFTLSSIVILIVFANLNILTPQSIILSVCGVIPVLFGVKLGGLVREFFLPHIFKKMVLLALLFMGVSLCLKNL